MAGAGVTLKLALALFATGALFALPPLYVPAIALTLLVAGSVAWAEAAGRATRVSLRPGPSTVEEGEPYPLDISIERGRTPPLGGELSHSALPEPLAIDPRSGGAVSVGVRFERWGRRDLEPPVLSVHDPLRLHRRRANGGPGRQVVVLPRVEPVLAPSSGNGGSPVLRRGALGEGIGGRVARAIDPEVDGVRPWQPGSPASRIHWPSVARTGELFERSLVGGGDSSPLVVLDRSYGAGRESVLKAVRAAASLCVHLAAAGGCSLLLPGHGRPLAIDGRLRSWPHVHARLALVDPELPAPAYPPSRAGAIFWITPAGRPNPRAWRRRAHAGGYLVTTAAAPGIQPAFEVAGCHGYPLAAVERTPIPAGLEAR
jgi:uncharacterized protein (DUF58 family)